jgi:hypothetical protein
MATRHPKRPRDTNALAFEVMREATGQTRRIQVMEVPASPIARLGGKARAKALSSHRRKEIAKVAAAARWKKSR